LSNNVHVAGKSRVGNWNTIAMWAVLQKETTVDNGGASILIAPLAISSRARANSGSAVRLGADPAVRKGRALRRIDQKVEVVDRDGAVRP